MGFSFHQLLVIAMYAETDIVLCRTGAAPKNIHYPKAFQRQREWLLIDGFDHSIYINQSHEMHFNVRDVWLIIHHFDFDCLCCFSLQKYRCRSIMNVIAVVRRWSLCLPFCSYSSGVQPSSEDPLPRWPIFLSIQLPSSQLKQRIFQYNKKKIILFPHFCLSFTSN